MKRGEYNNSDIRYFNDVIKLYDAKYKPTYKLICVTKNIGFKKFRKFMIDKYDFDPDEVDRTTSINALNKGIFYKLFISIENCYATKSMIDVYLDFYKLAKENNFDLRDRFLFSKVSSIKSYDRYMIQKLRERYSLIPAETIK